jgi:peptidoglycan/LPS O-acetylase OafA/YrhL
MSQSGTTKGYNPNIHGLRGFGALWVFIAHVYLGSSTAGFYPEQWPSVIAWLMDSGRYSVDLFFMISGYLITESLIKKAHAGRFLIDRVIRVYPAFLAAMLPLAIMGMLTQVRMFADTTPLQWPLMLLANVLLLPGVVDMPPILGVAWTLSFESVFYLTAAGAFVLFQRQHRELAIGLCVAAGLLVFSQYSGIISFYVGALIFMYRDSMMRALRDFHAPLLTLLLFITLWGIFNRDYWKADIGLTPYFAALGIACFVLELVLFNSVVAGAGVLGMILRSRTCQFMGTISYSFYLWHTPVMFVTKRIVLKYVVPQYGDVAGTVAFGVLSLPPAILIGYCAYVLFEREAGRYLHKRWLKSPKPQTASEPA